MMREFLYFPTVKLEASRQGAILITNALNMTIPLRRCLGRRAK